MRGRRRRDSWTDRRSAGPLITHVVCVAEVLTGARDGREQRELQRLFADFQVVHLVAEDSVRSIELLAAHRLAHGIGWPDCLIAATAERAALPVATLNDRHFAVIPGLRVVRPY
jgi:predicted nucleic acid-binding protein